MTDMEGAPMNVRAKVTGPFPVGGKKPGATVLLDPDEINVPALVAAGLIRLDKTREVTR